MFSMYDRIKFLAREPLGAGLTAVAMSVSALSIAFLFSDDFNSRMFLRLLPAFCVPLFVAHLWALRRPLLLKLNILCRFKSGAHSFSPIDLLARFNRRYARKLGNGD